MLLMGIIKNVASKIISKAVPAIATLKAVAQKSPKVVGMMGKAVSVARVGLAVAKKVSPIGRALAVGGLAYTGAKMLMGKKQSPTAQAQAKTSIISKTAKIVGGVVGAGAVAYGAEKLAEKMGIRGGAGFIGRRKRRKSRGKYAYLRVRRNIRGRGRLTAKEERKLRDTAKTYERSEGTTTTRHRKHGKSKRPYPYWLKKFMFKKGKRRRR
jgi:hypothetical protein